VPPRGMVSTLIKDMLPDLPPKARSVDSISVYKKYSDTSRPELLRDIIIIEFLFATGVRVPDQQHLRQWLLQRVFRSKKRSSS
jgi:site-specific recombinase XerD